MYTVEVRCRAMRSTLGLLDHYFLVLGDLEYHMGYYKKGSVLPVGTTKSSHLVCIKRMCVDCYTKIITNYNLREDKRLFNYYPIINCETLSTGISVQSLAFFSLPFIAALLVNGRILYALLLLMFTIAAFLAYGKFVFSRTETHVCRHLTSKPI